MFTGIDEYHEITDPESFTVEEIVPLYNIDGIPCHLVFIHGYLQPVYPL